jgi:YVTN family beta-propeller protein
LALSPDGRELWVTSLLDDAIYVYGLSEKKVLGRVAVGDGPNWVVFSPDGRYVCVSNTDSNDVSVIDAHTRSSVAKIKVGEVPKRIAAVVGSAP